MPPVMELTPSELPCSASIMAASPARARVTTLTVSATSAMPMRFLICNHDAHALACCRLGFDCCEPDGEVTVCLSCARRAWPMRCLVRVAVCALHIEWGAWCLVAA